MMDRSFVNPEIIQYWDHACTFDPHSAGCRFFEIQFRQDIDEINPYNVYSYCYYNDSFDTPQKKPFKTQQSILLDLIATFSKDSSPNTKYNGPPCAYFDGMYNYFNIHEI